MGNKCHFSIRLLREGIIVPALRGERPVSGDLRIRGFRLYDVWTGAERSRDPEKPHFDVYFAEPEERMTILDPEPTCEGSEERLRVEENHVMLRALQESTRVF